MRVTPWTMTRVPAAETPDTRPAHGFPWLPTPRAYRVHSVDGVELALIIQRYDTRLRTWSWRIATSVLTQNTETLGWQDREVAAQSIASQWTTQQQLDAHPLRYLSDDEADVLTFAHRHARELLADPRDARAAAHLAASAKNHGWTVREMWEALDALTEHPAAQAIDRPLIAGLVDRIARLYPPLTRHGAMQEVSYA